MVGAYTRQVFTSHDINQFQFFVKTNSLFLLLLLLLQSCLTLTDPTDCSPPDSSIHGIFQARALEWAAIPFSKLIAVCCKNSFLGLIEKNQMIKIMHNVRVVNCFVWGKMSTMAWKTAFQIAVRNCFEEAEGKISVTCDFSEKGDTCTRAHILTEACC